MEGLLLVPPERGSIIGRGLWKPRYVTLGSGAQLRTQSDFQSTNDAARKGSKALKVSSKPSLVDVSQLEPDKLYISIYKQKGDGELIVQHSVSAFRSCEVRAVQHRKQGQSLPTLILEMKEPDAAAEKQRKRRSSRAALTSSKDPWGATLLFRNAPDEPYDINDWRNAMKEHLTADSAEAYDESPMSPISPGAFSSFTNPFAPRESRLPSNLSSRPELQPRVSLKGMNTNPLGRDRPAAMISPSPSLRSRRSDISSQSSSMHPPHSFTSHPQAYTASIPSDLPSPASTSEYNTELIEGWTSAQGRSSALSSHTRGSNSIASAVTPAASTPPGPRETILDRAFQMRCIPGSERVEDEKISSIARFEALMRDADDRKRQTSGSTHDLGQSSTWDLDEQSEESSDEDEDDENQEDGMDISEQELHVLTPAQRALEYISSGRRTPVSSIRPLSPESRSPPIPFLNSQAMSAFHGHNSQSGSSGGLRPRTGTSTTSSHLKRASRPNSLALPSRSISTNTIPSLKDASPSSGASGNSKENRNSVSSVKRLSFQEFAKRLSSTSSLLLATSNTNASSSSGKEGSRRGSSEYGDEVDDRDRGLRASVSFRGGSTNDRETRDKRCAWRPGSMGIFNSEGGFL